MNDTIMKEKTFKYINACIIAVGFYFLFIGLLSHSLVDFDLWGYLAFGRVFWENGYFPYQDVFAYTPTKPVWVYHEWLTGVILYPLLKYLGPAGIQLLRYTLIVLTIYIMYRTALQRGATPVFAFLCISLSLMLMRWGYAPVMRAQIFTYLFFTLSIYLIEIARKDERWFFLLGIIPVQLLWCNLHGGFVAGLGLIALYALGEGLSGKKFMPFVFIFIAAVLVTLVNPYGIDYWRYIIKAVTMPRPEIWEWLSVFDAWKIEFMREPIIIFGALSVACLSSFLFRGKRYLTETIVIATAIFMGVKHVRHVVFLGVVFAVFMPGALSGMREFLKSRLVLQRIAWLTPILLIVFYLSANSLVKKTAFLDVLPTFSLSAPSNVFPTGALKWLDENSFEGNIAPSFPWGEYLIWSCYPRCKVAMDGRYETVYPEHVQKEYFDFLRGGKDWRIFLRKYPHDAFLLPAKTKIHSLMIEEQAWKTVYSDDLCVLFVKKDYKKVKPQNK
ncbi:MAG TPA: hypothetical protein PLT97_10215 [Smithellaceae bacterium]|nr:hypothetical protein [Smithellaceae bacterium]